MEKNNEPLRISTKLLVDTLKESTHYGQRFCFILGSGASIKSGIPMGRTLEMLWMDEIMKNPADYERIAAELKNRKIIENDFSTLKEAWEAAKRYEETNHKEGKPIKSEYYFDIYKLRFFMDRHNGYKFLETLMEDAKPSIGYRALAQLLAEDTGFDIVITTNFDSLTEDALFIYTDKRPIVVAHESLADYIEFSKKQRPVIAKVHRGLFYAPKNDRESTSKLSDEWTKVLSRVFATYTPIVIGYAGGDGSLMSYLENPNTEIGGTMYWCLMKGDEIDNRIKKLVAAKGGRFVEISGFDNTMISIAGALCDAALDSVATSKMLDERTKARCIEYSRQWEDCLKALISPDMADDPAADVAKKARDEEEKREKEGKLSAWDYFIRGYRLGDAGNYVEAIKSYSKGIELQPDYARAYGNRGYAYIQLGEHKKAIEDCSKAIELKPDYAIAYNNRGGAYGEIGEFEQAIADLNKALMINPQFANPHRHLGNIYMQLDMRQTAVCEFSEAIRLKPDYAEAYNNRGWAYNKLGEHNKAIEDLSKAIELKPDYASAYRNRAIAFRALGRNAEAEADDKKAEEIENKGK